MQNVTFILECKTKQKIYFSFSILMRSKLMKTYIVFVCFISFESLIVSCWHYQLILLEWGHSAQKMGKIVQYWGWTFTMRLSNVRLLVVLLKVRLIIFTKNKFGSKCLKLPKSSRNAKQKFCKKISHTFKSTTNRRTFK